MAFVSGWPLHAIGTWTCLISNPSYLFCVPVFIDVLLSRVMESSSSSSRPRTFELPKPETGLAEWTSKIKAMQRQVDADEEAEQKRLEEEIAASRLARLRRSHGPGSYSNLTSVMDLREFYLLCYGVRRRMNE